MASRKSFTEQMAKAIEKQKKVIDETCCQISRELFKLVVEYTPVGKDNYWGIYYPNAKPGTLVNNWQPAVNSINLSTQQRAGPDKSGAIRRIDGLIKNGSFIADGYVSLSNSTPYAYMAEYIGWPKPKWRGVTGPYAMVRKALTDTTSKYV